MDKELMERIKEKLAINEVELEQNLEKPWGGYLTVARNTECTSKILIVANELSLQSHEHRDEIWCLADGKAAVYRGKIMETVEKTIANLKETIVNPGDLLCIPKGTVHVAVNLGKSSALFIETSLGHAEEEDVKRYYDKHGRTSLERYPKGLSIRDLIPICREK